MGLGKLPPVSLCGPQSLTPSKCSVRLVVSPSPALGTASLYNGFVCVCVCVRQTVIFTSTLLCGTMGGVVHISIVHRWTLDANLRWVRAHLALFEGPVGSWAERRKAGMASK